MIRNGIWKRILFAVALLMISSVVLAACGDDDDADPTNTTGTGQTETPAAGDSPTNTSAPEDVGGDLGDLTGDVNIDGSSTVFPITQGVAEEFNAEAPDVNITVGVSGTGGGFEKFCAGDTDISNASRPIADDEIALCEENGIEYTELTVAIDGLSVVVNPENDWVDCITTEQLNMIWMPESTVTNWSDVDPSWPDEPIDLYGPGTDSGTFDYFTDVINSEEGASRSDYTASEDDNTLVTGVTGSTNALGYFGYAYYIENQDSLKVLEVDGGAGCVEPNEETVAAFDYPLSRPIFIYVGHEAAQREEVAAFVNFYLSDAGLDVVPEVGYVRLTAEQQAEQQAKIEAMLSGEPMPEASPTTSGSTSDATATTADSGSGAAVDLGDLSGEINIDGSSTVFPISQAVAEEFNAEAPEVNITVGLSGTGGGFEKFCAGDTDISNASRPIDDDEIALCEENGIEFTELQVAIDGLSVVVNPENDWVDCMTTEQLNMIWMPESPVTNWSDVDPSWPDEPIDLYGPGTDSGTFDYFTEVINGDGGASRSDYTASEDDNTLVTGVTGSANALGYFGYAYYVENQDSLKVLQIDGGEGCVEPTPETVASGEYAPLSRPIFVYVSNGAMERPEVAAFAEFMLGDVAQEVIPEVGYVTMDETVLEEQRGKIESMMP